MGYKDREPVHPATVVAGAPGERADRYPTVTRQQPERRVVGRAPPLFLRPPIEWPRKAARVVGECFLKYGVDRAQVLAWLDSSDLDPIRRWLPALAVS
jgi:hypothetical protein